MPSTPFKSVQKGTSVDAALASEYVQLRTASTAVMASSVILQTIDKSLKLGKRKIKAKMVTASKNPLDVHDFLGAATAALQYIADTKCVLTDAIENMMQTLAKLCATNAEFAREIFLKNAMICVIKCLLSKRGQKSTIVKYGMNALASMCEHCRKGLVVSRNHDGFQLIKKCFEKYGSDVDAMSACLRYIGYLLVKSPKNKMRLVKLGVLHHVMAMGANISSSQLSVCALTVLERVCTMSKGALACLDLGIVPWALQLLEMIPRRAEHRKKFNSVLRILKGIANYETGYELLQIGNAFDQVASLAKRFQDEQQTVTLACGVLWELQARQFDRLPQQLSLVKNDGDVINHIDGRRNSPQYPFRAYEFKSCTTRVKLDDETLINKLYIDIDDLCVELWKDTSMKNRILVEHMKIIEDSVAQGARPFVDLGKSLQHPGNGHYDVKGEHLVNIPISEPVYIPPTGNVITHFTAEANRLRNPQTFMGNVIYHRTVAEKNNLKLAQECPAGLVASESVFTATIEEPEPQQNEDEVRAEEEADSDLEVPSDFEGLNGDDTEDQEDQIRKRRDSIVDKDNELAETPKPRRRRRRRKGSKGRVRRKRKSKTSNDVVVDDDDDDDGDSDDSDSSTNSDDDDDVEMDDEVPRPNPSPTSTNSNNNKTNNNNNADFNRSESNVSDESESKTKILISESMLSPRKSKLTTGGKVPPLLFESRFESGNLHKAIQVSKTEYDLILNADINSVLDGHTQWFYFMVKNMRTDVRYKFNIINLEKSRSVFQDGMRPSMYSSKANKASNIGWTRCAEAENIAYYHNYHTHGKMKTPSVNNDDSVSDNEAIEIEEVKSNGGSTIGFDLSKGKFMHTLSFTIRFPYANDTVYLAHCYPYTYTFLRKRLTQMQKSMHGKKYMRRQVLCKTRGGHVVEVLTITDFTAPVDVIRTRQVVVLSARVHPGEVNASWNLQGVLNFLLSSIEKARELRRRVVFKIIPMLNPDGVINGNYRCSLSGVDLNRQYENPDPIKHPPIYYMKQMIRKLARQRSVMCYCDFHGHSIIKNFVLYGCDPYHPRNTVVPSDPVVYKDVITPAFPKLNVPIFWRGRERIIPQLIHNHSENMFDVNSCMYHIPKRKAGSARVVMWKELNLPCTYTMESSFCNANFGNLMTTHFNPHHFELMGEAFCMAIYDIMSTNQQPVEDAVRLITKNVRQLSSKRIRSLSQSTSAPSIKEDSASDNNNDNDNNKTKRSKSNSRRKRGSKIRRKSKGAKVRTAR